MLCDPFIARLTTDDRLPRALRSTEALLLEVDRPTEVTGFQAVLVKSPAGACSESIVLPPELHYLRSGDVVRVNPKKGEIHVLYRRSSPHNSLLVTERCNSKCLMCSQPPRAIDDGYIVDDLLKVAGVDATIEEDPVKLRPIDAPIIYGDASALQRDTGWRPTIPLVRTLTDVYQWYAAGP